jgi:hypothetical protein
MPIRIIRPLLPFLALTLVSAGAPLKQPPALTVLDYYMLLPERYFMADQEMRVKWMLDPKRGAIVDKNNGYLYARGDGGQTDIYVCVFKRHDGANLIGVETQTPEMDDLTYLDFYFYEDGKWNDVTKRIVPIAISESLKYKMPRYGKTIRVTREHGKRVYDLIWANGIFKLKRY